MKMFYTVIKLLFMFVCCHDLVCARAVSRTALTSMHIAAPVSKICEIHGTISR